MFTDSGHLRTTLVVTPGGQAGAEAAAPRQEPRPGAGCAAEPADRRAPAGRRAETLLGLRNRALLAVAYDTLARRSELVTLLVEDIEAGEHGAASILIRRSKVDQEGVGDIRYLAPDTMRYLRAWLAGAAITEGPIFRGVAKGGRVAGALSSAAVAEIFKAMATAAGVSIEDAARISGHSSRAGAAQDMARHGLELPSIMQAGGWRTATMVARYTARLDARRSGAAKLAVLQDRG